MVDNSRISQTFRWVGFALCICFVCFQYGSINTQTTFDVSVVAVAALSVAMISGFVYLLQRRRGLQLSVGKKLVVSIGALLGSALIAYYAVGLAAQFLPGTRQSFCAHVDTVDHWAATRSACRGGLSVTYGLGQRATVCSVWGTWPWSPTSLAPQGLSVGQSIVIDSKRNIFGSTVLGIAALSNKAEGQCK
jgi:hypothetical protein